MKKFFLILSMFAVVSIMLAGCGNKNNLSGEKMNESNEILMTVKEGTLTRSGATILIKDTSEKINSFSIEFRIDKKVNGKWEPVKPIVTEKVWTVKLYFVNEKKELEMDQNWADLYGKLENGEYRLVKFFSVFGEKNSHSISVEFKVS